MKDQLDLVTLTVSPEEGRRIATALQMRSDHFAQGKELDNRYEANDCTILSLAYANLRRKVEFQSGASLVP